jgi:cell division protein FtsQ
VLVVALVAGLGWLTLRSPWATVQRVEVHGTHRIPAVTVHDEADDEIGHPLLLARTGDIEKRVGREHLVKSVTVKRRWPSGLDVTVVERVPVAAVPEGKRLALVDDDGVVVDRVVGKPAALPTIDVSLGAARVAALRSCLAVLDQLPATVRGAIAAIGARSGDGVWLTLKTGARVEWGSAAQTPRKAEVLTALLKQKGKRYDVRAPDAPAIS